MVITLVMDQYGMQNNGTTVTTRNFAEKMRAKGHTVKIVTCITDIQEDNIFTVRERWLPNFIRKIVRSHGMVLAHPDKKVLRQAIEGSDIVHFLLPFKLSKIGKEVADEMGIPSTAAFHVQPQNISYNIGLGKIKWFNRWLYRFNRKFFNKFSHIHVPSEMMKEFLVHHKYTSNIHAISNGINDIFVKRDDVLRPAEYDGKFLILMTGRLSKEKCQDVLIKAIAKSKYKDKIQLILCGKGPRKKKLQKLSDQLLVNKVEFKFVPKEELVEIINYCDLYVHASEIESEAIACMEAFVCSLVPIISDSHQSATKQFALQSENLFKNGDSDDLAAKIDYFIENPKLKNELAQKYLEFGEKFRLDKCVDKLEEVFYTAIDEHNNNPQITKKPNEKNECE